MAPPKTRKIGRPIPTMGPMRKGPNTPLVSSDASPSFSVFASSSTSLVGCCFFSAPWGGADDVAAAAAAAGAAAGGLFADELAEGTAFGGAALDDAAGGGNAALEDAEGGGN